MSIRQRLLTLARRLMTRPVVRRSSTIKLGIGRLEDRTVPTTMYAVTEANVLFSFDSAAPSSVLSSTTVSGLGGSEVIRGIDFRPATGQLYGLGLTNNGGTRTGRIYTIDPATGVATAVGSAFSTTLSDTGAWGFDFNPNVDLIRITSYLDDNLRVNPNTGALAGTDTSFSPALTHFINDVAYTNSGGNASTTTLYAARLIDDHLVTIGGLNGSPSPNTGQVFDVGAFGIVSLGEFYGFDIEAFSNTARISAQIGGVQQLYSVNLTTGATTLLGTIGTGTMLLRGLTSQSTALTVGGTANADTVVVTATGVNSGSYTLNGGPAVPFSGITSFAFIGGANNDTLTINNPSGGLFAPVNGIYYHGGGQSGDTLELLGGTADSGVYNPTSSSDGTVSHTLGSTTQTVNFTGLAPINDTTAEPSFIVNTGAAGNTIDLLVGPVVTSLQTLAVSSASFETINLAQKSTITINGQAGNDTININAGVTVAGLSSLIVNGDDNDDTVSVQAFPTGAAIQLHGNDGTDTISYASFAGPVSINLGLQNNLTSDLDGTQENPGTNSTATATATVSYNALTRQATVAMTVTGLLNTITDSHIHLAPNGVNGPVIVPIGAGAFVPFGPPGSYMLNAVLNIPPTNEAAFLGGSTYFNIHTNIFPGGEIRGQIMPGTNVSIASGTATGTSSISTFENVTGSSGNDSLVGSLDVNVMNGGDGNDVIVGGPGADTFVGGNNDDVLVWNPGDGSDVMDGDAGHDTIQVNGGNGSEVFTLSNNSGRGLFQRTSTGAFSLDTGTAETLRLNENGGDDSFTSIGLNTAGSGFNNLQLFGMNGDDVFFVNNATLANGVRAHGNQGTANQFNSVALVVNGATAAGPGITGDGLFLRGFGIAGLGTLTLTNNAGDGLNMSGFTSLGYTNLTSSGNAGDAIDLANGGNANFPIVSNFGDPVRLTSPMNALFNVNGPVAGTDYDQVTTTDGIFLGNATLQLNGSYVPLPGESFTLMTGSSITGTFNGLAEGATVTYNTVPLEVNYTATSVVLAVKPNITSISRSGSTPTNAASVSWTVSFDVAVGGATASNFALIDAGSTISGESITSVTPVAPDGFGRSTTWTVTANTGTGDGTLGLNLTSGTGIENAAGASPNGIPFTGQVYTIDKTVAALVALRPIVTGGNVLNVNLMTTPQTNLPWEIVGFEAEFSEVVTGAAAATLTGGLAGTTYVSGNGTNLIVWSVTPFSSGSFTVGVGPVTDLAGNVGLSGSPLSRSFSTLLGDVNGDGRINNRDLNAIRNQYLYLLPYNAYYDLNGDGIVDREDYNIARSRIGT